MKKNDDDPVERIKEQLEILKLFRAKEVIDELLSEAARDNLPATQVVERLLSAQVAALIKRRIERRIRESKLPERKLLADYDFDFQTGVDKQQIMELATLGFAQRKQGVIFAGGSGVGKSHIAKALLLIGCQKNYRCLYTNAATMLQQLMAALADDTLDKKLKYYSKPDILSPCVRIVVTSNRSGHRWGSSPGGLGPRGSFPIGGGQIFFRETHFGGAGG